MTGTQAGGARGEVTGPGACTFGEGTTEKVIIMRSGYSSRTLLISSVPMPLPVPPPSEWHTWKPARPPGGRPISPPLAIDRTATLSTFHRLRQNQRLGHTPHSTRDRDAAAVVPRSTSSPSTSAPC